jgi:hypothetical protein
VTPAVTF